MSWWTRSAGVGLAIAALTIIIGVSDSMRPPYVGWPVEFAAAVVIVIGLLGLAKWVIPSDHE